jgi:hypothetical protein
MTKKEWEFVDTQMSGRFGIVDLLVDGKKISLSRTLLGKNRLAIAIFIDGQLKTTYIDDVVLQRYFNERKRYVYKAELRKKYKKRKYDRFNIDAQLTFWSPFFNTVASIKRQYEGRFKEIKLLTENASE